MTDVHRHRLTKLVAARTKLDIASQRTKEATVEEPFE